MTSAPFDNLGLQNDRRLMIVQPSPPPLSGKFPPNAPTHRFFTGRQSPSLVTVSATLSDNNNTLTLTCGPDKSAPIDISRSAILAQKMRYRTRLWDNVIDVVDMGDDAAKFIRSVTTRDDPSSHAVRLVAMPPSCVIETNEGYIPYAAARLGGGLPLVALSDGYPFTIVGETSLKELNRRLEEKGHAALSMERFRPNIVVSGTSVPFEEDSWKAIQIGPHVFHAVKGCPRCKQTCIDTKTGEVGKEPLETLMEFRKFRKTDVYFSQNMVCQDTEGVLNVGMEVKVLTTGDPVWDKEDVPEE